MVVIQPATEMWPEVYMTKEEVTNPAMTRLLEEVPALEVVI